jgi:hypothetical protein
MLAVGPGARSQIARTSLALHTATRDFAALHAVTGAHRLRLMVPRAPDQATPIRYFWQAVVLKIGFPCRAPDSVTNGDGRRRRTGPIFSARP